MVTGFRIGQKDRERENSQPIRWARSLLWSCVWVDVKTTVVVVFMSPGNKAGLQLTALQDVQRQRSSFIKLLFHQIWSQTVCSLMSTLNSWSVHLCHSSTQHFISTVYLSEMCRVNRPDAQSVCRSVSFSPTRQHESWKEAATLHSCSTCGLNRTEVPAGLYTGCAASLTDSWWRESL